VSAEFEHGARACVQKAANHCGVGRRGYLHFCDLKHHDKLGVLRVFGEASWDAVVVASDTTRLVPGSWLHLPKYQTNYVLRYVVERVSKYAECIGEDVESFVIEESGRFNLGAFIAYMRKLQAKMDPRIIWSRFDPASIVTRRKHEEPLLSIADALAHAGFKALEPDPKWGQCETAYLALAKGRLWRGPAEAASVRRYGFVLMPTSQSGAFLKEYPWLEEMT